MDTLDIVVIVLFAFAMVLFTVEMVYFFQMKRGYYGEYNGHKIEFKLGFGKGFLLIDENVVDKQSTVFKWVLVLTAQLDEEKVELRMTTGIIKPLIKLFVGGNEVPMKKNEKGKKDASK